MLASLYKQATEEWTTKSFPRIYLTMHVFIWLLSLVPVNPNTRILFLNIANILNGTTYKIKLYEVVLLLHCFNSFLFSVNL